MKAAPSMEMTATYRTTLRATTRTNLLALISSFFQATRTTQKRAKEIYTKHFDPESLSYFWYNTQIHTYFWGKPTGLGGWDVDAEDRVSQEPKYSQETFASSK